MRTLAGVLVLVSTAVSAQTIYRWTDKKGEVHYTDDLSAVPRGAKLETTAGEELMIEPPRPATPPPSPTPSQGELRRTIEITTPTGERRTIEVTGTLGQPDKGTPPPKQLKKQTGPIEVRLKKLNVPVSDIDRQYIEESLRTAAASPRLATWGGLSESVDVEIAPAEGMRGYGGSDAFGLAVGTNKVLLRAPRDTASHGFVLDYPGAALHELAHLIEHQQTKMSDRPSWFAEGFACVVTDQALSASIDDIAWWVIHEGGERPLDGLMSGKVNLHLAYAIAMESVRYLVTLVNEAGIKRMFELRAKGQGFEAAFKSVAGFSVEEFQKRFIESLRPSYYDRAR